jgi:subtilisin family serine protease
MLDAIQHPERKRVILVCIIGLILGLLYNECFGVALIGECQTPPNNPLYIYNSSSLVPWEGSPGTYSRCTYEWFAANSGQNIGLYCNGSCLSSVPANTNASIHLAEAWQAYGNSGGVLVGVVDTGVNYNHPDLQGVCVNQSPAIMDTVGHGTEIAGVIAATPGSSLGITGVVPGCQLLIENAGGLRSSEEVIPGMLDAITNHARVICCAWGFSDNNPDLLAAFQLAQSNGIICVCAALNSPVDYNQASVLDYPIKWRKTAANPTGLDNLIAVTSTMPDDTILGGGAAWGSDYIDFGAPGYAIPSTGYDITHYPYIYGNGTSIAAALTTGCVAFTEAAYPQENYHQTIERLRQSIDPGVGLVTNTISTGRLNLYSALNFQWPALSLNVTQGGTSLNITNLLSGHVYFVQSSTDMLTWSDLHEFSASGASFSLAPPAATTQCYYRVRLE